MSDKKVQIVLGIPGNWQDRGALVEAIATQSDGYIMTGRLLMNSASKRVWELDIEGRDPRLGRAFEIASRGRISNEDIQAIAAHRFACYLIADGGSIPSARLILDAACGLLRAGGLAVKVESSGLAHSRDKWLSFSQTIGGRALYPVFVTLINGEKGAYSCGMHNLGFRDAALDVQLPPDVASKTLNTFLEYLIRENPKLSDGNTFSVDPKAQRFKIVLEPCRQYPSDDLMHNPYGVWRLSPA